MSGGIGDIIDEIRSFTPRPGHGFNVVGVDDFEMPGEALYFVANFPTRKRAEAFRRQVLKERQGDAVYVYGPASDGAWQREVKKASRSRRKR